VLPGGHVVGVEPNPELLAIAAQCLPDVELRQGDALHLPCDAEQFDVTICVTVLEHMPDAEGAIPELVRVTKPGGRIGVMCGDQESFIVNHPDRALTRRILQTFVEARFANPWIGRQVPALLERHGVQRVQVRGLPTIERDPRTFPAQVARLRAVIAVQAGGITVDERQRWLEQLDAQPGAFLAGATYLFSWGVRI
jgi:SAM-dependent methyltransferase